MAGPENLQLLTIAPVCEEHWPLLEAIYEEGLATGQASFETHAPDWVAWDEGHLPHPRLVACESGKVIAWAALAPVSRRVAYAGVAEVSVYVAGRARGRGVGRRRRIARHYGVWRDTDWYERRSEVTGLC